MQLLRVADAFHREVALLNFGEGDGAQHLGLEGLLRECEVAVHHQRAKRSELVVGAEQPLQVDSD